MQSPATQQLPLRDLHLPAEPGFCPPAPGWWIIAIIVLMLAIWGGYKYLKKQQRKKRWLQLEQLWKTIQIDYEKHPDKTRLARELSDLLRRYVRHRQPGSNAAGFSDQTWINYLNHDLKQPVFNDFSEVLTTGLYQRHIEYEAPQLLQAVHYYLKQHSLNAHKKVPNKQSTVSPL